METTYNKGHIVICPRPAFCRSMSSGMIQACIKLDLFYRLQAQSVFVFGDRVCVIRFIEKITNMPECLRNECKILSSQLPKWSVLSKRTPFLHCWTTVKLEERLV